jgi:hypothetical protein
MGADFLSKTAKTYTKAWDRGRAALDMPQLFDDEPEMARRCYLAMPLHGQHFFIGAEYVVVCMDDEMQLLSGNEMVGALVGLPAEVANAIVHKGCGCAVATVQNVAEVSGAADVTLR